MSLLVQTAVFSILLLLCLRQPGSASRYSWMWYDHYDEIDEHLKTVGSKNCKSKSREDLVLRPDTVSQLPVYNQLLDRIWYRNRTSLIHLHNMALNRAFFYSYILQKMNDSSSFYIQPNWLYMYMSATADVHANPYGINGSAVYFDRDCHYPNWYRTVPFNNTLNLFGPKAWRYDDTADQGNILREPTLRSVMVKDLGAAGKGAGGNYTNPLFKMNPWYSKWLPDLQGDLDSLTKFTYYVGIKYSQETGKFTKDEFEAYAFFGPSSPSAQEEDERMLPVVFTQPYFDCGRYNNWIVSAVSPVVDYMPRYSNWTHMRRQRFAAVVVTDIEFKKLDFNACGVSAGNPGPSYLSGIHRCRATTNCKHKMGYGFKRGGYSCPCKSGTRYPWSVQPPWDGAIIEQATETEYYNGFQCTPSDFRQVLPNLDQTEGVSIVGGSSSLTSGGVEAQLDDSRRLVNPEFRTRNLRWTLNDTRHHPLSYRQTHGARATDVDGDSERNEAVLTAQHPEAVLVPRGIHAAVRASHDRKFVSQAQIEANRQRRLQEAAAKRVENLNKFTSKTDSSPKTRNKREALHDPKAFARMMRIFRQKDSITAENCHQMAPHNLVLSGDVAYGVQKQFESEGRTALRLSYFLSNYLQNTAPTENFGNLLGGGRLHVEHLFGEVIANVMGNFKIYSAGVFFDRYQFENQDGSKRELFGPWAYRENGGYYAIDTAGMATRYTDEDWYQAVKARWATNTAGLKTFNLKAWIRSDPKGTSSIKHDHYPLKYKAPEYASGHWTRPHFRCDGKVDAWVITYAVPFFGLDSTQKTTKFKGVVTVDVPLNLLELNPCPMGFGVANAFKNTAHCDYFSTKCSPIAGYPFVRGAYSCKCRSGFEYPHFDGREWFQGSLVESEYEKKVRGMFSRYDQLRCRVAGSPHLTSSVTLLLVAIFVSWATTHSHS